MRISGTGALAEPSAMPRIGHRGFTLVEILVVVAIMALLAGFAMLAVRGRDAQALVDEEAARLQTLLTLAREEAVFRYRTIGVWLHAGGYRFLDYRDGTWLSAEDDLMRPRELREGVGVRLYLDGRPVVLDVEMPENLLPQIVVYPDGVGIPFEIVVEAAGATARTLQGSATGEIEIERKDGNA